MPLKIVKKNINLWMLLLLLCMCEYVLTKNPYKSGEVRADNPKGCAYLRCKRGEQCVSRKFWCGNPPCPSMLYCSKSRKESLKGPSSCEAVRCSKGYVCLVKVRHCQWDEPCAQQIARCVLERDYYDGPASCVDYKCPSGLRCILRESLCAKPPCKLVKSCANPKDVKLWYDKCKSLGCLSSHECFLRRPPSDCRNYPCKHTPDCSAKNEEELEANEQCRGWVCPKGEDCAANLQQTCTREVCKISRSCHRPLMIPLNVTPQTKRSWRDDAKLNFYSNPEKNLSTTFSMTSGLSKNNKVSRHLDEQTKKKSTDSATENYRENPTSNSRSSSSSSRPPSVTPDIISGSVIRPTVTSLSNWLDHLRLKTGVDAIEAWTKMAEKQENYRGFLEWLESVKDMLGSAAYDLWMKEVRAVTVTSPAFQNWLSRIPTSSPSISPNFVEPVPMTINVSHPNPEISFDARKSTKNRNNENENYQSQEKNNFAGHQIGTIKIDDFKDESYLSLPNNDTSIQTRVTENHAIPTPSELPTASFRGGINEWQNFYGPDPGLLQRPWTFPQNSDSVAPWPNQAPPFQAFDTTDPVNRWYQSMQQSRDDNSRFLNYNNWPDQFSPFTNPQLDRRFMDRRFLQSTNPNQQFQANWTFQQSPNEDPNFFHPWNENQFILPANPSRDRMSVDQRFLEPGTSSKQQFQTDWSISQPEGTNPYYFDPNYWQTQIARSPNSQQHQDSMDQKLVTPEKFSTQQFPTNWTFQQFPNVDPNFPGSPARPEMSFSQSNPEWQPQRDFRDQFYRSIVESPKIPGTIVREINQVPFDIHSNNYTSEDTSWLNNFHDRTSQHYVPLENFGSSPIGRENVGPESWSGSNYRGLTSLSDVPHRRTKHEDSTSDVDRHRYVDGDAQRSGITTNNAIKDRGFIAGFPGLLNPRYGDYRLHLQNRNSGNVYDDRNRVPPPVASVLSRTRRIDADAGPISPNLFFVDGETDAQRRNYHRPNSYPHDRIYETTEPRAPAFMPSPQRPGNEIRRYDGGLDPFPKPERPEVTNDRNFGFLFRDRGFDGPLGVSDLWNSKFRTPLGPALHRLHRERASYGDSLEQKRPVITTVSTPLVPFSRSVAPQPVQPIAIDNSSSAGDDDNRNGRTIIENYDEDDGIYPLVLSLQGYIETSKDERSGIPAKRSSNSTILPVYTVEESIDEETGLGYDYESFPDNEGNLRFNSNDGDLNLFKNVNYGGTPDFPNNLKNAIDMEAGMVMAEQLGRSDVEIKDLKWEYDDGGDGAIVDVVPSLNEPSQPALPVEKLDEIAFSLNAPSGLACPEGSKFNLLTSPNESSDTEEARDWVRSGSALRNEDDIENDYHDEASEAVDHGKTITGVRSNYNFRQVNSGDSLNDAEVTEHLVDSFYNDSNHKRFKKNRP